MENILLCLEMSRGEYIATLDGDDYWTDYEKLQQQADILDAHPEYSMSFHNCSVEYEENGRRPWELCGPMPRESVTFEDLLEQKVMVQTSTIMMRRRLVGEFRAWPQSLMSDWFVGILASRLGPVGYIDRVMSVYRQHASSFFSSLSRAGQWAEITTRLSNVYEQLGGEFGKAQYGLLQQAVYTRSYLTAMQYEKERDFINARKFLSVALKGKFAWLEPYGAGSGLTGKGLRRRLTWRLRLYRFPSLFTLWLRLEQLISETRWRFWDAIMHVRFQIRLDLGDAVGVISASPNPAPSSAGNAGISSVALEWTSIGTEAVEVHLGRPDGPLISRTAASGRTETGAWVSDGTVFYLQDVFANAPLTRRNTLDIIRVRVKD